MDFRTDSLGSVGPNDVTRDGGARAGLFFGYDPNLIFVPNEGHSLSTLSDATHYAAIGVQTVYAQNDFGEHLCGEHPEHVYADRDRRYGLQRARRFR